MTTEEKGTAGTIFVPGRENNKKNLAGKKWWIIGGVAAVAVIVALIVLLLPKQEDIPTFGLKAGMSADEIISAMEKNGMTCDYNKDNPLVFSGDKTVFGKKPSAVVVWPDSGSDHIVVEYIFCGQNYTSEYPNVYHPAKRYDDLTALFDEMWTSAKKKLGSPEKDYEYQTDWNKDGRLYSLYRSTSQDASWFEFYTEVK